MMSLFKHHKKQYPKEQMELHKTALELKGISINLQRTAKALQELVDDLRGENKRGKEENYAHRQLK
jgi:hypothetical protein